MRDRDLAILDHITLEELELTLDDHTRQQVPVDQWTAFSWSVSRHKMFERCRRQYYLYYYGAKRVHEAKSRIVSAIWWLKQVTSLDAWIGSVIHHIAAMAVRAHRDGAPITAPDLEWRALDYFRGGMSASERGHKHDDRWILLFEHLFPDQSPLDVKAAEQRVVALTQNFQHSDTYMHIRSLSPKAIREVDEPFQSFDLPGVPRIGTLRVFAIPDVLLLVDNSVTIVDWKTGDAEHASIRSQAGTYALYAHHRYGIPERAITVQIADLNRNEILSPPGGLPSLAEAQGFLLDSVAQMVEQMDYLKYNTVSIKNFPMTEDVSICQNCPFRRACWRHQ